MTFFEPQSHPVLALPPHLRRAAVERRIVASEPLARVIADLAFGPSRRDDVTTLHLATGARVAAHTGACS